MDSLLPMREIWDIIDGWLVTNTPWISDSFAPPATDEQLKATKDALGFALPEDVRQSYRIRNGHRRFDHRTDRGGRGFIYGDDLQTLEWITDCWKLEPVAAGLPRLRDTVGPVRRDLAGVRWVPLTSGANYMYYLDMDPAPGGDVGQIVMYIYDEVKAVRVNKSWHERLEHLAVRLTLGMYVYSERLGYLVTVKHRADEIEAMIVKSPADMAEYERLREIQARTTLNKQQLD